MKLREMEEKDNQQVGKLVQTLLEANQLNIPGTAYYDPYLFELYAYYQQPKAKYWVLEEDGKVIGGAGVGPFDKEKRVGELQKLYISEEAQGRGYSKQLLTKALAFAKEHYNSCYIETFDSLKAANHLYLQFGFKQLSRPLSGTEHGACDTWFLKEF